MQTIQGKIHKKVIMFVETRSLFGEGVDKFSTMLAVKRIRIFSLKICHIGIKIILS